MGGNTVIMKWSKFCNHLDVGLIAVKLKSWNELLIMKNLVDRAATRVYTNFK